MIGRPTPYTPDTLYQLIDGEADAVKQYAMISCIDARYSTNGRSNPSIDINIYDMTDGLNAFGLFSQDRQGGKPIALGAGGTRTSDGTGISFWKGRYLVRIASTARTPQYLSGMVALGRSIAAKLPGSSALPPLFKNLPPGQQPGSEKYLRTNVEARAFLSNGVTARYPALGATAELFVSQFPSPTAAQNAYGQFLTLEKRNRGLSLLRGVGAGAFAVLDTFQRNVVVAVKGARVIGVVRAASMPAAQALVKQAVARVS